jgi:hypothetical protein
MPENSLVNQQPDAVRVAVVATGIVSPLGFGLSETLAALREGGIAFRRSPASGGALPVQDRRQVADAV